MEKHAYKLSKLAQSHLHKIKTYTVKNCTESQWCRYKDILLTGFQMLADNPSAGITCDDIYPKGLYFPIGKHTVYYTKEVGFILVLAVLGQAQLPQKHVK